MKILVSEHILQLLGTYKIHIVYSEDISCIGI